MLDAMVTFVVLLLDAMVTFVVLLLDAMVTFVVLFAVYFQLNFCFCDDKKSTIFTFVKFSRTSCPSISVTLVLTDCTQRPTYQVRSENSCYTVCGPNLIET